MLWFFLSLEKYDQTYINTKVKYLSDYYLYMKSANIIDCLFCFSHKTKKHGVLKQGGQRYKCNDCHHSFTLGGVRGTYDYGFRQRVIENYCHKQKRAVDVVDHYGISTRTLVKRSKDHKKTCIQCNHCA